MYRVGWITTPDGVVGFYDQVGSHPFTSFTFVTRGRCHTATWERTFTDRRLKTLARRFAAANALGSDPLSKAAPALLEALRAAEQFISNGIELGFIRLPDPTTPDSAHYTLPKIRAAISQATASSDAHLSASPSGSGSQRGGGE